MLGEMTHMLSFVLFFIPLRMLVGGYHCRKSETCFFCTLLVYGASTLSIQLYETEIMEEAIWILAVISILIILIWSPLVNPNHLLEDYQIRRNKNIIYVMVVIDVALYGIFCKTNIAMAHSEMMFTDSFHGSVFSVIFDKPFRVFKRNDNFSPDMWSRMDTLINLIDDYSVIGDTDESLENIVGKRVKYDKEKIEVKRKESLEYLKNALNVNSNS